jgi:hypothetical protein
MRNTKALLLAALSSVAITSPAPAPIAEAHAEITPPPLRLRNHPSRTVPVEKRNILSDLESKVTSALASLGSNLPSYVASGELESYFST